MSTEKYKIAVVDDENEILSVLNKFLTRDGKYVVSTFSNPLKALELIDDSYDVVLSDIMMPQMNGLDFLQKLKEKNPAVSVIMMTAYSTLDKVLESHRNGAKHYIMKPFKSLKELDDKIIEVLKEQRVYG